VILRLKENEGRSTAFALRCTHSTVTSATVCDLLEEERVSVSPDALTIGAYETLTIRLRLTENE
jgi:alpha-mannosidase